MTIVRHEQRIATTSRTVTEESVASGETGNPIIIEGGDCTVSLFPSGSAKVQYTTSRTKKVSNNTARWLDWARGAISAAASDIPEGPIVAVRVVSVAGDAVIEVVR